jgi:hypothetical protein
MKTLISDIIISTLIVLGFGSIGWFFCFPPEDSCVFQQWLTFFGVVVVSGIFIPIGFALPNRLKTGKWE